MFEIHGRIPFVRSSVYLKQILVNIWLNELLIAPIKKWKITGKEETHSGFELYKLFVSRQVHAIGVLLQKFVGIFLNVTEPVIASNRMSMSPGLRNYASANHESDKSMRPTKNFGWPTYQICEFFPCRDEQCSRTFYEPCSMMDHFYRTLKVVLSIVANLRNSTVGGSTG